MKNVWDIADSIEPGEVTELALELGRIDSPSGQEHAVSDFLLDWCGDAGLAPRPVRALPDQAANVVARIPGRGGGRSLLFNSHMDTAVTSGDYTYFREPDLPEFHTAWRDGADLVGAGVVNDKGPMACWLVAAATLRRSGVQLPGDLVLTMVTGEIGHEPVDEYQGPRFAGKDYGSRFVATHGALADYVVVAETTSFTPIWIEPGKAFFRIAVRGRDRAVYTPYLQRPYAPDAHPNAIVRAAPLIPAIERWAYEYQERSRIVCDAGEVVPKVNIGAIRAGHPTQPILSPASCIFYLDVRLPPGEHPLGVQEELRELARSVGVDAEVECYLFRRGYQAAGAEPLVDALWTATDAEVDPVRRTPPGHSPASMWRDLNVWNEMGMPAVTFGPGQGTGAGNVAIVEADLHACARIYLRTALAVCAAPRA
ncbi:M20/M25/M40 family metallo-hydrolase [Rhizomonospora bruguierae]|uniref:M20/M25/M40 family metallo-hydrolase n=1 Tax=Rhizomonospora bruguierae TaxID=1581705 RepID=UPI001BCAB031|nr:M20/M25/M40 family metallo-hydrolase [Micromonospora sp. NBRC 107566]